MDAIAVVATAFGGPEVLALVDEQLEAPGQGEVAIEVRAAGTNPVDYKQYSGQLSRDASLLPLHLGSEAAGVVTEVGPDAIGPAGPIRPGDEVIAYRVAGAYATQLVVPATAVVPKPANYSFEQAAGLLLTGCTAVHALTATRVGPGESVVLHGAAGGVGLMAVQLAVAAGARVVATASPDSHGELRALGAEPVAYGDGLLERLRALAPDGFDAAVDLVGTAEALDASVALVAERSRIVTIVRSARAEELKITRLGAGPGGDPGTELRDAARMELVRRARDGQLQVVVAAVYPLAEAAAAHRQLAGGHTHGKIVLVP